MSTGQNRTIKPRLNRKQKLFIEEYLKNYGHISKSCKKVKISRSTFYEWKETEPFYTFFDAAIEEFDDTIQSRILELALNGNCDMLKFWAKHKMKKRGFTDKFLDQDKEESPVMKFVRGLREAYEESQDKRAEDS